MSLRTLVWVLAASSGVAACGGANPAGEDETAGESLPMPGLDVASIDGEGQLVELGRALFFDSGLSAGRNQSCASCHAPTAGFTGPDSEANASGAVHAGSIPARFGNRKPQSASYVGDSPVLHYDEDQKTWFGGSFWDGRATGETLGDPLAEQAMGPFLNPLEQALPNARLLCLRVAQSDYAGLFASVWGAGSINCLSDAEGTFIRVARSIAAYERSPEVNPFTSRFDAFWRAARLAGKDPSRITAAGIPGGMMGGGGMTGGGGMMGGGGMSGGAGTPQTNPARWEFYRNLGLSDEELKGLAVFNDPNRGNCASCHSLAEGSNGYPLLTDFGFYNLGLPRNPANPFYGMPPVWNPDGADWIDEGLGGYLRAAGYPPSVYEPELGKFKTPSLRNVDQRPAPEFVKAFGHNGFFKSLDGMTGIVHFYAWRAMMDAESMGMGMGDMMPDAELFPPPELDRNRVVMQPFNFMMNGAPLVAFLATLSDTSQP